MIKRVQAKKDHQHRQSGFVAYGHAQAGRKKYDEEGQQKSIVVSGQVEDIQTDYLGEVALCLIGYQSILSEPDQHVLGEQQYEKYHDDAHQDTKDCHRQW